MTALVSSAFGMLMVLCAAGFGGPIVLAVVGLAVVAVVLGAVDHRAAPVAVVLTVIALALSDPAPLLTAASGICAAAYLVTRYGVESGAVTLTIPTVVGMVGFTLAGLVATAIALPVRWVPLLAPAILATILIVVATPLLAGAHHSRTTHPDADAGSPG